MGSEVMFPGSGNTDRLLQWEDKSWSGGGVIYILAGANSNHYRMSLPGTARRIQ